nr:hypothetical protein 6 [Bacillaceae bacterium]
MEVNDRGIKKWTSIMLPEHVEALKTAFDELEQQEKPILDEQQKVEIDLKLQMAIQNDLTVTVEYFEDHEYHRMQGKLLMVDVMNNCLRFEDGSIKLDSVVEVHVD